jgi:hypothetical protein
MARDREIGLSSRDDCSRSRLKRSALSPRKILLSFYFPLPFVRNGTVLRGKIFRKQSTSRRRRGERPRYPSVRRGRGRGTVKNDRYRVRVFLHNFFTSDFFRYLPDRSIKFAHEEQQLPLWSYGAYFISPKESAGRSIDIRQ